MRSPRGRLFRARANEHKIAFPWRCSTVDAESSSSRDYHDHLCRHLMMRNRGLSSAGVHDEVFPVLRRESRSFSWPATHDVTRSRFALGWAIWTLAAALSLVTSKHILVTRNYHYPLHLLLLHLAVAGLGSSLRPVRRNDRLRVAFVTPGWKVIWRSKNLKSSFELLAILCAAASVPLAMQTLIHFSNLATLAMLAVGSIAGAFRIKADPKRRRSRSQQRPFCFECLPACRFRSVLPS